MQAQPQVANVLTPSGQIQQIQIASLANVQVRTKTVSTLSSYKLNFLIFIYVGVTDISRPHTF